MRAVAQLEPVGSEAATFEVPEAQIIGITDLVFESCGDLGRVRLLRNEDELITLSHYVTSVSP